MRTWKTFRSGIRGEGWGFQRARFSFSDAFSGVFKKSSCPPMCGSGATVLTLRTTTSQKCERFRGGLVFKAHIRSYHSTLGLRVIKKKKKKVHSRNPPVVHCVEVGPPFFRRRGPGSRCTRLQCIPRAAAPQNTPIEATDISFVVRIN